MGALFWFLVVSVTVLRFLASLSPPPSPSPTFPAAVLVGAPSGQSKVLVSVSLHSPDLFHVVLRYVNWGGSDVVGRVSVIEDDWSVYCGNCECRGGREAPPLSPPPVSSS